MKKLAAILLLLAGCATGGSKMAEVDALLRDYTGDVPGASVLVIEDGRAVVSRAYGLADVENGIAATPATNYRLASVTKQFTAAAILLLEGDGRLSLDDRAQRWLPSLPQSDVTIRQLLTHSSGLIDYEDVMPADLTTQLKDADVLRLLESQRTTYFAPGTSYRYSNSGYALLALIVEKASGQTFAAFLHDRIFAPFGMSATVAHEEGVSTVAHRAFGHSRAGAAWQRSDQSLTSAVLGDGGMYSSIDDLAKWDAALADPRFAAAFVPRVATDDPTIRYGYGWRITGDTVWHTGETIGFRNAIVRFPAERLTVVILTNRNEGSPHALALKVAALFRDR